MSTEPPAQPTAPAGLPPALQADYDAWARRKAEFDKKREAELAALKPAFGQIVANAQTIARTIRGAEDEPVVAPQPGIDRAEQYRLERFVRVCGEEFDAPIDRKRLKSPAAFDRVAQWDGVFPGPCAVGATERQKTRAAWALLQRIYVKTGRPFIYFTAKRLMSVMESDADDFFREHTPPAGRPGTILFVDDADKINWDFQSNARDLFAFYDFIYRRHVGCVTTTNKDFTWWKERMGDAFVRRFFKDAHFEVKF